MTKFPIALLVSSMHMTAPAASLSDDGQGQPVISEQMETTTPTPRVRLEYTVDPVGNVKTCEVLRSSNVAQLDARSCPWLVTLRGLRLKPGTKHQLDIGWKLPNGSDHLESASPEIYVSYFRSEDYPVSALKLRMEGRVVTRSTVSVDGTLRDCAIIESSGHDLLDEVTCKLLLKRARFSPALDRAGQPIESSYVYRVVWGLPR